MERRKEGKKKKKGGTEGGRGKEGKDRNVCVDRVEKEKRKANVLCIVTLTTPGRAKDCSVQWQQCGRHGLEGWTTFFDRLVSTDS